MSPIFQTFSGNEINNTLHYYRSAPQKNNNKTCNWIITPKFICLLSLIWGMISVYCRILCSIAGYCFLNGQNDYIYFEYISDSDKFINIYTTIMVIGRNPNVPIRIRLPISWYVYFITLRDKHYNQTLTKHLGRIFFISLDL